MKPREQAREIPEFLKKKEDSRSLRREPPTWRRQMNDGFQNPDGSFSWAKTFTIVTQACTLYHFNRHFESLMYEWDALAICSVILLAPEIIKKIVSMKYGGNQR